MRLKTEMRKNKNNVEILPPDMYTELEKLMA